MSLDTDGFEKMIQRGEVTIVIDTDYPLIKLGQPLSWEELLHLTLPDLT